MEGNVQVPQASRTNIRVTAETGSKELIVKASSDFFSIQILSTMGTVSYVQELLW